MSKRQLFFPPFRLDPPNAQLWRDAQEISLRRKTFDVLVHLADRPGQLVTKQALLDAVWPEVSVSDSMPSTCVKELRKALGDEAKVPQFIETVHGRGYRFIAKVTSDALTGTTLKPSATLKGPKFLVGRDDELAQMQSLYAQVVDGQRRIIFITGEAGIGKSAFLRAFLEAISAESAVRVGRGQCVEQYGAGEPYMPVLEALGGLGQQPGGEGVVQILNRFAPTWLAQMPALLTPEERFRLQGQTQVVTQQRMLREMTQALEALAAQAPLVLLLEDLHWSDFSTIELISAVARRSEPAPLLIVGTYRPVDILAHDHPLRTVKEELELHSYCEEVKLRLLSEDEVADYLARRFSVDGAPMFEGLAPAIHQRTDGNPLFMINVVDYMNSRFPVSSQEAAVAQLTEIDLAGYLEVPRSVRQMIERNLHRLKPEEQEVLESASVAGPEFSAAAVAAALQRPQHEVEACCVRLSRREQFLAAQGLISWPDGTISAGFRFRHSMYQEVLYGLLPAAHRLQLHRLIAVREETGYGERVDEVATELAHHYVCANDKSKAIQYLRLAGERAVGRGAVVEAEGHYQNALKLLIELPRATERDRLELTLRMEIGSVLWSSRSWSHPEAGKAYARALVLAEELSETTEVVMVLKGLLISAIGSGQCELATTLGERMLIAAERSNDRASRYAAHSLLGEALVTRGQYLDAQKHLELRRRYYDEKNLVSIGIDADACAAIVTLLLGFPDRARALMDKVLQCMDVPHAPSQAGLAHSWGAMFSGLIGDPGRTLEHAQALCLLAAEEPVWAGFADLFAGEALTAQGNSEAGMGYLHKAFILCQEAGLNGLLTFVKLSEAELLGRQRRMDDALALVADAIAATEEFAHLRSRALRQRANLLAEKNADASATEAAYRSAIECARAQSAKYYELQTAIFFARWLKTQQRVAEAYALLVEIYNWFTEGFDTTDMKKAKVLLDELSNDPAVSGVDKP